MRGRWKRVSPRASRVVDGSKRMKIMVVHWVFILEWSRVLSVSGQRQEDYLVRNQERVGWFCQQNLRLRQFWNFLSLFSSKERGKRIQINFKQEGRESKAKRKGIKVKAKK